MVYYFLVTNFANICISLNFMTLNLYFYFYSLKTSDVPEPDPDFFFQIRIRPKPDPEFFSYQDPAGSGYQTKMAISGWIRTRIVSPVHH